MLFLLGATIAALSPAPVTKANQSKVVVDGATYRVRVDGTAVSVAKKAFMVILDLDERDRMRKAVTAATGCSVIDEMPAGARLVGRLSCPAK